MRKLNIVLLGALLACSLLLAGCPGDDDNFCLFDARLNCEFVE